MSAKLWTYSQQIKDSRHSLKPILDTQTKASQKLQDLSKSVQHLSLTKYVCRDKFVNTGAPCHSCCAATPKLGYRLRLPPCWAPSVGVFPSKSSCSHVTAHPTSGRITTTQLCFSCAVRLVWTGCKLLWGPYVRHPHRSHVWQTCGHIGRVRCQSSINPMRRYRCSC